MEQDKKNILEKEKKIKKNNLIYSKSFSHEKVTRRKSDFINYGSFQNVKFRYPVHSKERNALENATPEDLVIAKNIKNLMKRTGANEEVVIVLIKLIDEIA